MTQLRSRVAAISTLAVLLTACSGAAATPTAPPAATPTTAPATATAAPGTPTAAPATPTTAPATPTEAPATGTPVAMTDVPIQLDFILSGSFAPLLWGIDKGFFEERGINPDFIPGDGSDDALAQLNSGNVDYVFADGSAYIEQRINGDTESTAVYAWYPISTTGIITVERTGEGDPVGIGELTDPVDMDGKSFGTVAFSSGKVKIPKVLQANGVDYPDWDATPTLVELMDFGVLYPTLFSGDIDSAEGGLAGSYETAKVAAAEQGLTAYFKPISDWGYKDYSKLLVVSNDAIANKPDEVARVIAAISESELDALANASGDDIYALQVAYDPQAPEEGTKNTWESFKTYMIDPGPIDPSVFQYQLDFLADQGTTTDLTPEDLYTNEFIPE